MSKWWHSVFPIGRRIRETFLPQPNQPRIQETAMPSFFDPVQMGDLPLPNRIVMAALTHNRAIAGLKPGDLTVSITGNARAPA